MGAYPDLPVQPRSSGYRARRWNIKSDGLASTNTGRSDPPPTETIENSVAWHLRNWLKRRIYNLILIQLASDLRTFWCAIQQGPELDRAGPAPSKARANPHRQPHIFHEFAALQKFCKEHRSLLITRRWPLQRIRFLEEYVFAPKFGELLRTRESNR